MTSSGNSVYIKDLDLVCWCPNIISRHSADHNLVIISSNHYSDNVRGGVLNRQSHDCLRNRLFRCRLKKTSKLRATGLCEGNSSVTGEFPAQRTRNAEVSIWWRHHELIVISDYSQTSVNQTTPLKWPTRSLEISMQIRESLCKLLMFLRPY